MAEGGKGLNRRGAKPVLLSVGRVFESNTMTKFQLPPDTNPLSGGGGGGGALKLGRALIKV